MFKTVSRNRTWQQQEKTDKTDLWKLTKFSIQNYQRFLAEESQSLRAFYEDHEMFMEVSDAIGNNVPT